jgi:hypothetical protein
MLLWGAQLEQANAASFVMARNSKPSPLIRTSSGVGTTVADNLNYPSSNINPAVGTICLWFNFPYSTSDLPTSKRVTAFSMSSDMISISATDGQNLQINYDTALVNATFNWTANTWTNVCGTYNQSGGLLQFFINGSFIGNRVGALLGPPAAAAFNIGNDSALPTDLAVDGIIGNVHVWNVELSSTDVSLLYSIERSGYGV